MSKEVRRILGIYTVTVATIVLCAFVLIPNPFDPNIIWLFLNPWLHIALLGLTLLISIYLNQGRNSRVLLAVSVVCLALVAITTADMYFEAHDSSQSIGSSFLGSGFLLDGFSGMLYFPINAILVLTGLSTAIANSIVNAKGVSTKKRKKYKV